MENVEVQQDVKNDGQEKNGLLDMILAKKTFGILGWGLFVFIMVSFVAGEAVGVIAGKIFGSERLQSSSVAVYLLSFVPMYAIAFPLLLVIIRKLPKYELKEKRLGVFTLIKYFCMCLTVMYVGNIIGTLLSSLISSIAGKSAVNNIAELLMQTNVFSNIAFVVVFGPVMEEILFRKILIDRTAKFGERNAVFLSALLFGLFHVNLFQFFYAFGIGLIFGLIYVKTGKIIYTIVFHMIINFLGSVVSVQMVKVLSDDVLSKFQSGDTEAVMQALTPEVAAVIIYGFVVIVGFFAGIVFLITERKKLKLDTDGAPFSKKEEKGLVYGNYGMAFFIATCIALTALRTIGQMI